MGLFWQYCCEVFFSLNCFEFLLGTLGQLILLQPWLCNNCFSGRVHATYRRQKSVILECTVHFAGLLPGGLWPLANALCCITNKTITSNKKMREKIYAVVAVVSVFVVVLIVTVVIVVFGYHCFGCNGCHCSGPSATSYS